jgi:hypothetical protein
MVSLRDQIGRERFKDFSEERMVPAACRSDRRSWLGKATVGLRVTNEASRFFTIRRAISAGILSAIISGGRD